MIEPNYPPKMHTRDNTLRLLEDFIEYLFCHHLHTAKIEGSTIDYFDLEDIMRAVEAYANKDQPNDR